MFGDVERRVLRESGKWRESGEERRAQEALDARLEIDLREGAEALAESENGTKWIAVGREHAKEILEWIHDLPNEMNMKMFALAEKVAGDDGPPQEVYFYLGMNQKTPAITLLLMDALAERKKRKALAAQEGEDA